MAIKDAASDTGFPIVMGLNEYVSNVTTEEVKKAELFSTEEGKEAFNDVSVLKPNWTYKYPSYKGDNCFLSVQLSVKDSKDSYISEQVVRSNCGSDFYEIVIKIKHDLREAFNRTTKNILIVNPCGKDRKEYQYNQNGLLISAK